jgi:hypothetical protein
MGQRTRDASNEPETHYCPAECMGFNMTTLSGNPDPAHVTMSDVEQRNLTKRPATRLTAWPRGESLLD